MISQIENDYDWLQNPNNETMIEGLPPNEESATTQRSNNLFNYAPDEDESLETYGNVTHTTPTGSATKSRVTPDKKRSKTKKKYQSSAHASTGNYAEDLTDDQETVNTLSSRPTFLETDMSNLIEALNKNMQQNNTEARSGQEKHTKRGKKPAGSSTGLAGGCKFA